LQCVCFGLWQIYFGIMPFGGLLAGVSEDLLCCFQIALVTGVCGNSITPFALQGLSDWQVAKTP
jgi:hypothetical protein